MEGVRGRKFFAREPFDSVLPAACGGGRRLFQVPLLGFVYQIWQNNFKSLSLFFIGSQ